MMMKLRFYLGTFLALTHLIACAPIGEYEYVEGKVNIVATTTMLGDLATQIGGEHVHVITLMKAGVDPHSYNPKPSDTRALAKADLVLMNGLHLEAKMGDVLASIAEEKRFRASDILEAMSTSAIIKDDEGQVDPHIWGNILHWTHVAEGLSAKLVAIDNAHQADYLSTYEQYRLQLDDTYEDASQLVDTLDISQRVLVTAHDAFAYFGQLFAFEVYAIQGISTQSEASVKDIQDLANLVVDRGVNAIFVETSVPENTIRSVLEAVEARGETLRIGGHLYSDSLGSVEGEADTYINMYRHNVETIVTALQGEQV